MKPLPLSMLLALVALVALGAQQPAHGQPTPANEPVQTSAGRLHHLGPFDRLELGGAAQVRYRQGDRDEVLVEGDEEAQRQIELSVSNGRLHVRTQRNWWPWGRSRVKLQIVSRELRELGISGAADFVAAEPVQSRELRIGISGAGLARFDQLQAGLLRFSVSGAGDGRFAGQVEELRVGISGKGDVQAEQLHARRAQVSISGLGKAKLWVGDQLEVTTSGIGTVDYWGQPQVQRRTSGVSQVNGLGEKAAPVRPAAPAAPAAPTAPAAPAPAASAAAALTPVPVAPPSAS